MNTSHYKHGIQSIKFDPNNKNIYFSGNELTNVFGLNVGGFVGIIDTLGNNFYNSTCAIGSIQNSNGYLSTVPICSDYKIEPLGSGGQFLISNTDISSRHHTLGICQFRTPYPGNPYIFDGILGSYYSQDSIFSRIQFAKSVFGNKIIRVISEKNKIHADISSSYNYNHKTLDNLNLKHAYSSNNRVFITATDSSSDENLSQNLITIELDTALNVLNSVKLQIDSVWINSSHTTILDSTNNYLYNVFLRKGYSDSYIYVQKTNLSNTNCHESPIFISSSTNTLSAYTFTTVSIDTLPKITYNPLIHSKGFKSEDACPFLNTFGTVDLINNSLSLNYKLLTLSNNEFVIESPNTIKDLIVLNSVGQQILSKPVNDNRCALSLNSLSNGMYFISITNTYNDAKTFKVIKQE